MFRPTKATFEYWYKFKAASGNDADATMILTALPPDNWRRPPGRPRITWLNTVQWDLRAYNLTLNEAVDLAQNRPLWRLMSTWCYALLVAHDRKEEEEELVHSEVSKCTNMTSLKCLKLVSWSLTSLFSTNMAISETNGHSLWRTPSSPLFSCPGLSPWSSCA